MKTFLQNLALFAASILAFLVAAEVVLRLLPVDDGLVAEPVTSASPVFHFVPKQTLTWSRGPTFGLVNRIHVNNAGFVNDQDYVVSEQQPLIAVVGDSQVEAAMVPFPETLHGRLAADAWARVYSFAASGAPLSQYVVWAKHAKEKWGADFLVVVVIGNDFDESLLRFKASPGFHYYAEGPSGLRLERVDYTPGRLRGAAKASALARYLLFNVQILNRLPRLTDIWSPDAQAQGAPYAGNTSADLDVTRVDLSKQVVQAFLRDMRETAGWRPENVLFVVDGFRYPDRAREQAKTYFGVMRGYFIEAAGAEGFAVIDMDDVFLPEHAQAGTLFEFPNDGHWNGEAHALATRAIAEHVRFSRWKAGFH